MSLGALSPVLVAGRGEIAVRVMRTVRALGLRSVAVHSDADAGAAHVRAADVAVRIGPAEAARSYLDADAILAAARATGARSVHPGYGFLSENAAFARAVGAAGLTWIGPPADAIELMGDKARAKALARESGVPVVPGVEGDDLGTAEVEAFADDHGLPVVVKALAGGGGRGMRVVRAREDVAGAVDAARREAEAAFGDGRLLVERFLDRPRHVEVQVLADRHGGVVHLGERECSLQRRHQKVVEEAPSPALSERARTGLGDAAVALARACGYVGAGTVEFVVAGATPGPGEDPGLEVAFLEMNTRLQVEHPVTELVHGVDLVEQQLRVAAGEALALEQDALRPRGHAVEVRLYAEDPAAGFLPATGTVAALGVPSGEGLRFDLGVGAGDVVHTHYDPMIGKVVAHGPDREVALGRLDRALAGLEVLGSTTSAAFCRALLAREDVRAGEQDTGLLERVLGDVATDRPEDLVPAGALVVFALEVGALAGSAVGTDAGPGAGADGSREVVAARRPRPGTGGPEPGFSTGGAPLGWRHRFADVGEVTITGGPGEATVIVDDRTWVGAVAAEGADDPRAGAALAAGAGGGPLVPAAPAGPPPGAPAHARVTLDGVSRRYAWAHDPASGCLWIARDGHHLELRTERLARTDAAAAAGSLEAPMPGTVLDVRVAAGDAVAAGDVLVVLESMKMELSVEAPHDGVVGDLALAAGDRVQRGQVLVAVTANEDGPTA